MIVRRKTASAGRGRTLSQRITGGAAVILWIAFVMLIVLHLRPQEEPSKWVIRQPRTNAVLPARTAIAVPNGEYPVNTANADELAKVPGIGPSIAEAIIYERQKNGLFYYPEDLLNVRGIGEKTLEKILPYVNFQ